MTTPRVRAAIFYVLLCSAAFFLGPLGVIVLCVPIAIYFARGRWVEALGLVICAGIAALVRAGTVGALLYYLVVTGMGFPLGVFTARRWTYGWIVAVVSGTAFLFFLVSVLSAWDTWSQQTATYLDNLMVGLKRTGGQGSGEPSQLQVLVWLRGHWVEVGFGWVFGQMVIGTCVILTVVSWFLRKRFNDPGPCGSFKEMRPPDALVWLVIVTAALWFFDYGWPHAAVRLVSWNAAVALFVVYSLNGLSVLVYILDLFKPNLVVYVVTIGLLVYIGAVPILALAGLFDTWGEFRSRLDRFVAARKVGEGSGSDES